MEGVKPGLWTNWYFTNLNIVTGEFAFKSMPQYYLKVDSNHSVSFIRNLHIRLADLSVLTNESRTCCSVM